MTMTNNHLSKAIDRLIDSLLSAVKNDPDFPTAKKLALLRQNRPKAEPPRLLFKQLNRVGQLQNKPYSSAEYLEIIRRQKPADDFVPYAQTRGSQWIESTCYFLRRIFGYKDRR
jgi:hypothetical protein